MDKNGLNFLDDYSDFLEKRELLESKYNEVSPFDFYRDLFPEGSFERLGHQEDRKANGIALSIDINKTRGHRGTKIILTDGLEQLDELLCSDFVVLSPIGYFGRNRYASNAMWLYALTLDIDFVSKLNLENIINWFKNLKIIPRPTYIVNSGHGLHIYYFFKDPLPMYKNIQSNLKNLKTELIRRTWTRFTSVCPDRMEALGVVQSFRMVGSKTKCDKYRLQAYKTGERVDIDYLNSFLYEEDRIDLGLKRKTKYSLDEAKKLFPDWYERRIVKGEELGKWNIKRDLYDWFLRKLQAGGGSVGHRYFCIMCLAIYASKCNVDFEEVKRDALDLQPNLSYIGKGDNFTIEETLKALDCYYQDYDRFPRDTMQRISAIPMKENKRNGLKQREHLEIARTIQKIKDRQNNTNWRKNNGRPKGSRDSKVRREHPLPKKLLIQDYVKKHPKANHSEIARALNISRPTVIKWLKNFYKV